MNHLLVKFYILSLCTFFALAFLPDIPRAQGKPQKTEIQGHDMYTLLKPGDIPAIFEPEFVSSTEADSFYYPDEPLMVVAGSGIAKGYSTWHLDHHEVVNDYIDNKAITVTW